MTAARAELAHVRQLHGERSAQASDALLKLSDALLEPDAQENLIEGTELARKAVAIRESLYDADDPRVADALDLLILWLWYEDAFDEMLKNEELMQNATFVVQQSGDFRPNEGRPVREVLLWGALEPTPDGYSGNHMSVAVAAAPFPIPISFKGTFRMYRMESVASRGFVARLLDVFAGCGRTR